MNLKFNEKFKRIFNEDTYITKDIKSAVYMIRNIETNKIYIGSSVNYKNRWSAHIHNLENNNHSNRYLQHAYNKYGYLAFEFTVIISVYDIQQLRIIEQSYIDFYSKNFKNILYNINMDVDKNPIGPDINGEKNPKSKLSNMNVLEIRKQFSDTKGKLNERYKFLGNKFNVSELSISRVVRNKSWKKI